MTDEATPGTVEAATSHPPQAILVELDNIAATGRQIVYKTMDSVLRSKGVKLTPEIFSRYCVSSCVKDCVPALLKAAKKESTASGPLVTDIQNKVAASIIANTKGQSPAMAALTKAASEVGVQVGYVSCLPEATAKELATKVGVEQPDTHLVSLHCEDRYTHAADAWLTLAKKLSVRPSAVVALSTSSESCKAALSAGMRTIALPDSFTSFQDFGGADYVKDTLDDETIKDIFDLLSSIQ